ncbi:SMR family transporter [Variovorax sp. JS1663]|uniref:SMR family transporter n=1 Tax=Variovorax sp. JS1663 TaxID=1851577 RepID=UPI000B349B5C|nr:SMR family transporter [Variovorax sp. JS1663]OUM01553.1 4-amino-4-deoxy-L-arabinose transferase [Variovorax sp. JS1663]
MTLTAFSIILAGVLLNSAAQLMLKAGAQALGTVAFNGASLFAAGWSAATQPWILVGLCCYFVSAGLWILALTRVDVTVAYPMLSMGYVIAALLAWHFFGEALTASRVVGIAIILVGVVVLGRG